MLSLRSRPRPRHWTDSLQWSSQIMIGGRDNLIIWVVFSTVPSTRVRLINAIAIVMGTFHMTVLHNELQGSRVRASRFTSRTFGNVLLVYNPVTRTHKTYVVARDRVSRELSEPNSASLPPFHHIEEDRDQLDHLNVFLVALNAEIRSRRHFEMIDPPTTPLPDHLLNLMCRTMEIIRLVYWVPVPTKG